MSNLARKGGEPERMGARNAHATERFRIRTSPRPSKGYTMEKGASSPLPLVKGGRGLTLVEMLITLAIVAIVAVVVFPSYTSYVTKSRQQVGKAQLMAIRQAEEAYKLQYGTYCGSLATLGYTPPAVQPWSAGGMGNKYTYSITASSATTFTAQASGDIDRDPTVDVWTIDQDGTLTNVVNDVTQ